MTLDEAILDFETQIRNRPDYEIVPVTVGRLRLLIRHLNRLQADAEFNALSGIKEA